MCNSCIDPDVLPQNESLLNAAASLSQEKEFLFAYYCSTFLKEGTIKLKTSLPEGECCPVCGRLKGPCNFTLSPVVKIM